MEKDSFEKAKELYDEIKEIDSAIRALEDRRYDSIRVYTTISGESTPFYACNGVDFLIVLKDIKLRLETKFEKL